MGYFYPPFWLLLLALAVLVVLVARQRGFGFNDLQLWIAISALSLAADMLMCKQWGLYNFVHSDYKGWYSFWAGLIFNPAIGFLYTKLLPSRRVLILLWTLGWIAGVLLFELCVAAPWGIVQYLRWRILPWSAVVYIMVFPLVYSYYRWLKRHQGTVGSSGG